MLLRVAVLVAALAIGLAGGGWLASLSNPSTSLDEATAAARLAFPDAGPVRDPDVVPGHAGDGPAGLFADGYEYRGFEYLVPSASADLASARDRLEAAGWRTWELGDRGFGAAGDGLGLTATTVQYGVASVTVGAVDSRVVPISLAAGIALAVGAWFAVPAVFAGQRRATLVAAVSLVAMVPAVLLTLVAGLSLVIPGGGDPWPAPWMFFMIGDPPLAVLAVLTLLGAGVAGLLARRWSTTDPRVEQVPVDAR